MGKVASGVFLYIYPENCFRGSEDDEWFRAQGGARHNLSDGDNIHRRRNFAAEIRYARD